MNHTDRLFSFCKIDDEHELMDAIYNHKWPLCYGFYHQNLLYLCDGDSEELPEYSIVAIDQTEGRFGINGREVGRIKPNEIKFSDFHSFIHCINRGIYDFENPVHINAEPKWHHSCPNCSLAESI